METCTLSANSSKFLFTPPPNSSFASPCPNDAVCLLELVAVIAVTVLILAANVGSLTVLLSTPSFRNAHGYLLVSLGVADLGVGCVCVLSIYPAAWLQGFETVIPWPYGELVCLATSYALPVFTSNSGYTVLLLSIERYIAVAHPMKYTLFVTKKAGLVTIVIGWILVPSVLATILTGTPGHVYSAAIYACITDIKANLGEHYPLTLMAVFVIILPTLIFIGISSHVVAERLKESDRLLRATATPCGTPRPHRRVSGQSQEPQSRKTVKMFRMVRVMAVAVCLCWVPFCAVVLIHLFFIVDIPQLIMFSTYWLLLSNSFINALIYFIMNATFRGRVLEIMDFILGTRACRKMNEVEKSLACACFTCKRRSTAYPVTSGDNNHSKGSSTSHLEMASVQEQVQGVYNCDFHI